jgi:glycosyltransferase involved in cell wall biosynthesis
MANVYSEQYTDKLGPLREILGRSERTFPLLVIVINVDWYFRLHWLDRILMLKSSGFRIVVITNWSDPDFMRSVQDRGIICVHLEFSRRGKSILKEFRIWQSLYDALKGLSPSLIHNITVKPNIYGGIAARLLGIPTVSSVTGLGAVFCSKKIHYKIIQNTLLLAYRVICNPSTSRVFFENIADQALFLRRGVVPINKTVKLQGAGVDLSVFRPYPEPSENSGVIILFAARLLKSKGLQSLVDAVAELRSSGQSVTLCVAGIFDNEADDAISVEEIKHWEHAGFIEWLGQREDMQDIIAGSHIVCLPTTYGEGIPRILIEGAACGRPLVATNIAGCNEIIEDGVNGFLIGPSRTLKDCLSQLINDSTLRNRMGEAGRRRVLNDYSQEAVVAKTISTYIEILDYK